MPTNKVMLGAAIGALSMIIVWSLQKFANVEVPPEIALAGQTVLVFIGQYLVPNSQTQVTAQQKNLDSAAQI